LQRPGTPVGTGDVVIGTCGASGNVIAWDNATAALERNIADHASTIGSASIANGVVYVPGSDGIVRAYGR
jgi:hypothetical protein